MKQFFSKETKAPKKSEASETRATVLRYKTALAWTSVAFGVAVLLVGAGGFALAGYARLYENRVFPGVRVLDVRLDGLTEQEAGEALHKAIDEALRDGLRFRYDSTSPDIPSRDIVLHATTVAATDPDASRELIRYDVDTAVRAAMSYGRSASLFTNAWKQWRARVHPVMLSAGTVVDEARIRHSIEEEIDGMFPPVEDARLVIRVAGNDVQTEVIPEKEGRSLDVEPAFRTLWQQAESLSFAPIPLRDHETRPTITAVHAEAVRADVPDALAHAPFILEGPEDEYEVSKQTFANWLGVTLVNNEPTLSVVPERFASSVRALAPHLEQTAKKGSLVIEDGKILSFEAGTEGVTIDDHATRAPIAALLGTAPSAELRRFPLVVHREPAALDGADPEELGIREIIGTGRSDFSGSPVNRRKNIALGAQKINGTLIPPGGEFSMLDTLGEFTYEAGWLPELVIKGNKTVPELGGGLCQVGTTAFRAALSSGLPITQRRNHSYRVRYYEPAGTDATIYDPAPDFRFANDTDHHILIHAYSIGDELIYEFWGTEDDRKTVFKGVEEVTEVGDLRPVVYNVTAPPPTKLIETLDLPPGQKKCTESAHAGADASFTYTVTYPDGTTKEETFTSHYRPWQAVCLVGVEALSEPAPAGTTAPVDPS